MSDNPMFFLVAIIFALILMTYAIFGRLWWQKWKSPRCKTCRYPTDRCECPPACTHPEIFKVRWTQDGWMTRCKVCSETLYLGDDYHAGPKWP